MCFGFRRGVCGVRGREAIRGFGAHARVVTQNLRVRIHQNKELNDFGPALAPGSRQVRDEVQSISLFRELNKFHRNHTLTRSLFELANKALISAVDGIQLYFNNVNLPIRI